MRSTYINYGAMIDQYVVFEYSDESSDDPTCSRIVGPERVRELIGKAEADTSMKIAIFKLGECVLDWS